MAKILSKSGDSLADVYNVQGSIAGIDQLLSEEVHLVHEMGSTIFSERLSSSILVLDTAALSQTTDFAINFFLGRTTARILGVQVLANQSPVTRILRASVNISTPIPITDMPIWTWVPADLESTVNIIIAGSSSLGKFLMNGNNRLLPNITIGSDQPFGTTPTISFRGKTATFGAGTVIVTALIYFAFASAGGLSSRGLPLPGW